MVLLSIKKRIIKHILKLHLGRKLEFMMFVKGIFGKELNQESNRVAAKQN